MGVEATASAEPSLSAPIRRSVILVEGEPLISVAILEMIARTGHDHVGTAKTVDGALVLIATQQPDIIVLSPFRDERHNARMTYHLHTRSLPCLLVTREEGAEIPDILRDLLRLNTPFSDDQFRTAMTLAFLSSDA